MTLKEFRERLFVIAPGVPVIAPGDFPIVVDKQGAWTIDLEWSTKGNACFLVHPSFDAAKLYGKNRGFSCFVGTGK